MKSIVTNESLLKDKNLFKTAVMVSLRAREISLGGKPLVDTKSTNPTIIALEETKSGKLRYTERK